jgi:hypothetical protein
LEAGKADTDGSAGANGRQQRAHGLKAFTRVVDSSAREHAYKLITPDASDHVIRTQACSHGICHGDEQYVPVSVTCGIIRGFEPIHVDIGSHELSADTLRAIDLAPDGS